MTKPPQPLDLLRRAAAFWTDRVDAIHDDQWANPTPCTGWTVRQLVVHVIERDRGLAAQMDGAPRDDERSRRWLAGEFTFGAAAARLNTVELTIHGWDLSRGLGMDDRIDPELVDLGYQYFSAVDRGRAPP